MPQILSTYKDQLDWFVALPGKAERIVSLVPSQTEYLCSLGLEKNIVGITKFCIHPESCYRSKVRVGGTKDFDLEAIRLLEPDIIIANKEENEKEQVLKLKTIFPTWISDVRNLSQALEMMNSLGVLFGKEEKATEITRKIEHNFLQFLPVKKPFRVLYLIWRKPYMSINRNTFIHNMLEKCGFKNVLAGHKNRYPKVSVDEIEKLQPDLIFLSSEPFPFREKHFPEMLEMIPEARTFLVDGEYFSWYGSRLINAPAYFRKLIRQIEK